MRKSDFFVLATLGAPCGLIWLHVVYAGQAPVDSLFLLAAFPLFIWLGRPWRFSSESISLSNAGIFVGAAGLSLGALSGLVLPCSIGFSSLLLTWLHARVTLPDRSTLRRLMVFPLLAFPWISSDFNFVGWWFRLSGAWSAAAFFKTLGLETIRRGTELTVQGFPASVGAACSGMNTLQATLLAGAGLTFLYLRSRRNYWISLLMLPVLAWLANTIRIIVVCAAMLTYGPAFASGTFHPLSGNLIIVSMFLLCLPFLAWQRMRAKTSHSAA